MQQGAHFARPVLSPEFRHPRAHPALPVLSLDHSQAHARLVCPVPTLQGGRHHAGSAGMMDRTSRIPEDLVVFDVIAVMIVRAVAGLFKEAAAGRVLTPVRVLSPIREVVLIVGPDRFHHFAHVVAVSVFQALSRLAVEIRVVGFAQQGLTPGRGRPGVQVARPALISPVLGRQVVDYANPANFVVRPGCRIRMATAPWALTPRLEHHLHLARPAPQERIIPLLVKASALHAALASTILVRAARP